MCLSLQGYKSRSEAISLRGCSRNSDDGGSSKEKGSATLFSCPIPPGCERFHPNPLAIALMTFYLLYKNLTLPSGAG